MIQSLINNFPIVLAIAYGVISEGMAVIQILKYPTNSGVGGVLAGILKVLLQLGAKPPGSA